VVTLFVRAGSAVLPAPVVASGTPLPLTLSGFSVALTQTVSPDPIALPLFAVFPLDNCYGLVPSVCSPLTALTVQIPWQLRANFGGSGRPENFAVLRISYQGTAGDAVPLTPSTDAIHVISTCDTTLPPVATREPETSGPCRPLVTHMDGQLVTPASPATPGETVVAYLVGLGVPAAGQRNGEPSAEAVAVEGIRVGYQFGLNLPAVDPASLPAQSQLTPSYAGLTPGQVGLYQISFAVPSPGDGTPPCQAGSLSNVTVIFARTDSFAGAGFCVAE
jgi:uncharacterized protein (TIGR03437 family)